MPSKYNTLKKIIATIILSLCSCFHSNAQENSHKTDSIVQNAVKNDLFEGTVLIADNGNIIYHKSFGFTDEDNLIPIKNLTSFGIASITKMFTAIIVLQLVEEGKFQLDDKLSDLLPDLKIPKSNKITVHHLLLHITGLPNERDEIYAQPINPREFVSKTLENKLNRFGKFNYANIDYVLLGLIIEKYSKTSWKSAVQKRIIDQLSMARTGFLESSKYPGNFAYTFTYKEDAKEKDPLFYIENFYAAGAMYSTAEDLLKLDQAMYSASFLSVKSKELMFKSYPEYNYSGYSVWTYNYPFAPSQPKVMERRGSILGAKAVLIRFIETNKTIIILSNNDRFNPDSFGNPQSLKEALMIEVSRIGY